MKAEQSTSPGPTGQAPDSFLSAQHFRVVADLAESLSTTSGQVTALLKSACEQLRAAFASMPGRGPEKKNAAKLEASALLLIDELDQRCAGLLASIRAQASEAVKRESGEWKGGAK